MNVDPANLIAEVSEENNNACGDFSRLLDSDGDGLTDYEETRGMRVAFSNAYVRTYAGNAHSDYDGLTDGQEMGRIVYDADNKRLYDTLATLYGWDKSLYDGYHYEYIADPMKTDTDDDGLDDKQELDAGTNPLVSEYSFLMEASLGYVLGDFGLTNPAHDNMAYLIGTVASGLTPLVEWVATVRDVVANAWNRDWFNTGITAGTGLLSVLPVTVVADEVPEIAAKMLKFVRAFPHKITEVGKYIVNVIPDHAIRLLDEIYQGAVTILKGSYGFSDEIVKKYAHEGIDLGDLRKGLDNQLTLHNQGDSYLNQRTLGKIAEFELPLKKIEVTGSGKGGDVIATTFDGRTIGREIKTINKGGETLLGFKGKVGDAVDTARGQIANSNIREVHIQVNSGTEFTNNAVLREIMDSFPINYMGDPEAIVPLERVMLYDSAGNILAQWVR
ncbi:hypothetical protein ANME2D_02867 [Candidatus Methanoperedens nitroreducens]|uniref:Uncharacterized protein n=1 Tax=Candidatus Methanoperedens nitratireducens TaxID=1392998 RepID=A0A062V0D3_9EURY|nr:hypothetical protein ANME2D_02867 [Candidatus Methanoperedens nitroreducens]MDJ1420697.1 hypothetical protein [Candidatus Methanoperedens sp.]